MCPESPPGSRRSGAADGDTTSSLSSAPAARTPAGGGGAGGGGAPAVCGARADAASGGVACASGLAPSDACEPAMPRPLARKPVLTGASTHRRRQQRAAPRQQGREARACRGGPPRALPPDAGVAEAPRSSPAPLADSGVSLLACPGLGPSLRRTRTRRRRPHRAAAATGARTSRFRVPPPEKIGVPGCIAAGAQRVLSGLAERGPPARHHAQLRCSSGLPWQQWDVLRVLGRSLRASLPPRRHHAHTGRHRAHACISGARSSQLSLFAASKIV